MSPFSLTIAEIKSRKGAIVGTLLLVVGFGVYYVFLCPGDVVGEACATESSVFALMLGVVGFISRLVANSRFFLKERDRR